MINDIFEVDVLVKVFECFMFFLSVPTERFVFSTQGSTFGTKGSFAVHIGPF